MISFIALASAAAAEAGHAATGEHESVALWQDPSLWVGLAFLIVVGLFWKMGVHKSMGASLAILAEATRGCRLPRKHGAPTVDCRTRAGFPDR